MPSLGGWEWVILVIVAVLIFGGSRLAGVGKSAGQAIREFKEEVAKPINPQVEAEPAAQAESNQPASDDKAE
jgi:sec-independent protein translocase protein TatA